MKGEKFEQQASTELSPDDSSKDLCPLANFGCCKTPMSEDVLEQHMQLDQKHHLHLLVHNIQELEKLLTKDMAMLTVTAGATDQLTPSYGCQAILFASVSSTVSSSCDP